MASIVVKSPIRRNASHGHRSSAGDRAVKAAKSSDATAIGNTEAEQETALSLSLGKCTLSKTDHQILSLIQHIPRKRPQSSCLENFHLYQPALDMYKVITSEKPPKEDVRLPDKAIRRKVYQLVFDTLYRE